MPVQRSPPPGGHSRRGNAAEGHCVACREPDEVDNLVRCDFCKSWFHWECAGVGAEIENHIWLCQGCENEVSKKSLKKLGKRVSKANYVSNVNYTRHSNDDEEESDESDSEVESESSDESGSSDEEDTSSEDELDRELELIRREREILTTSKDLPPFSGKASEWPVFISCFKRTTTLCNIPDDENILRLQKALTGIARKLVEAKLTMPECVDTIISDLTGYFGRPEYIVEKQLDAIKKAPGPKIEDLSTVVLFSAAVNNLVATLEQANMVGHLSNPNLLREIIDKLPPHLKLDWASYKRKVDI